MPRNPAKIVERMAWSSLRPLLSGSEADCDLALSRLKSFAVELLKWNQGVSNLISHDDELRVVDRHIAESLAGSKIINALGCNSLVDFGSGGGFPALPLALAGTGSHWTLVESRRNKTLFLRRAVQELAMGNITVLTGRLETLIAEDASGLRCTGFTSRATMKAGPTLEMAARIVEAGGHAILWKGSGLSDEIATAGEAWQVSWEPPVIHELGIGSNSICVFRRK
jgi:16S rRNA (guanine527-N7)-methyltransferase